MKWREKFRSWLLAEITAALPELASRTLIASLEKAERDRHKELMDSLARQEERLAIIESRFKVEHVGRKTAAPGLMEWEQVQAEELARMLLNPPPEEN